MKYNAYKKDDKNYVSVTSCLGGIMDKPQLYYWFKKVTAEAYQAMVKEGREDHEEMLKEAIKASDKIRDLAGDYGSRLHRSIESLILGHPMQSPDEDLKEDYDAFTEWYEKQDIEMMESELQVFHDDGWAGTVDFIGTFNGKKYILDWKTSNYIDDVVMPMQMCAYMLAYGEDIEGIAVVHIKDKKVEVHDYSDIIEDCTDAWWNVFNLWKFRNRRTKKFDWIIKGEENDKQA